MKGVILVPRRDDGGYRDRVWAWCKAWWQSELPELEIFEGHHDTGLFNRSAAVNAAAAKAGRWDVAVIIDSDVICDPPTVREALDAAYRQHDRLVMPFTRRHNLNQPGSLRIMAGDRGSWRRYIAKTYTNMVSSCVMVPRQLWDQVGGFDERFEGWGFEDNAFAASCETFGTSLQRIEGELWHLFHPTAVEGKRGSPSFNANRARAEQYHAALGDKKATRALLRGELLVTTPLSRANENIPRILHRVVPEVCPPEAERWWAAFAKMHPGWTLLTHRDPLKAQDWPITSPYWELCTTGAQLAGLIRLEALWQWGGIYVDQDVQPLRSLEPLLACHAFAAWEDEKVVPDAVLGAEPEHLAIRACLDMAISLLRRGARGLTNEKWTWDTGAAVTTKVLPSRSDVLVLPPGAFYQVHYRDPDRDRKMRDFSLREHPWAFVLHWYWGSWLEKKQSA